MLTGRTVDENQHYLFEDYVHPTGRIRVLDFEHPNARAQGGQAAGDAMLRYLAKLRSRPSTWRASSVSAIWLLSRRHSTLS